MCVWYVAIQFNALEFGDCFLNEEKSIKITMLSRSDSNKMYRFEWPSTHPHVKFFPSIGHMLGGTTNQILATFSCDTSVALNDVLTCHLHEICVYEDVGYVWDNRYLAVKWKDVPLPSTAPKYIHEYDI